MVERNGLAAAAATDNSTAEGLADEDFIFEGEDGQLVGAGDDYGDDGITGDDVADGTETSEELGEAADGTTEGEVTAGQPAATAAAGPAVAPTAAPAAQTTPQAPTSEAAPQRAPMFHELVRDNFDAAVEHVVRGGNFALSAKDAEVIDPAAAPILQRVAAQVYLKSVATFSEMLHNTLPQVVRSLQTVGSQEQQAEQTFLTANGFKAEHVAQVTQVAQFVRLQNPKLVGADYAKEVARMAHAMLGTTPPASKPNGQAAPGKPAGPRTMKRQAFTPAGQTGGPMPARRAPGQPAPKKDPMQDLNDFLRSGVDLED